MDDKPIFVCDGAIGVIVSEEFGVYEKRLPKEINPKIDWLGNFGIFNHETDEKLDGKVPEYRILTLDREDRTLFFWNDGKTIKVPDQKTIVIRKKKFRTGLLNLGDPPLGWD